MGLHVNFFFLFFLPRFCPGHISGTVTHRDSKLSVLLGPAVQFCTVAYHPIRFVIIFFFRHDFVRRRVFHLRGIAPRSHTGRPRTCLVIIVITSNKKVMFLVALVCLFVCLSVC